MKKQKKTVNLKWFPQYTWWGTPRKWQDRGEIELTYNSKTKLSSWVTHAFCNTRVHIGKEGDEIFYFCPKCLIQVKSK